MVSTIRQRVTNKHLLVYTLNSMLKQVAGNTKVICYVTTQCRLQISLFVFSDFLDDCNNGVKVCIYNLI